MATRAWYPTQERRPDAEVQGGGGNIAGLVAFDRVMQRILGFAGDLSDRRDAQAKYQTEQERLGRAEQRGIEATAEEQRRYAQQQQIAGGTREANALLKVAADPNARSAYEGRPGYEGLSQRPVVDQRFPVVPAGQDLYGQPAPAMPTEGPPEPIYGQSPLDVAQTAAYQRQKQGAFSATGTLGMQIQTATDLQSVFTEIDGKTGVPGGFTQPEADDIKARLKAAFEQQLSAAKAMEEARLAIQRRAASSGSGIAPQRFTSRDLDEAAYAGDIDAYNRYRKAQGIRPLVLSNAGDKQQWEQAQARSRDMRQQKVSTGDITQQKALGAQLWGMKDDPQAALAFGEANGLSEDQVRRLITAHDQTIKRSTQTSAADKATAAIIQEKARTIRTLEMKEADAKKLADKTAIRAQINRIKAEIGGAMGDLAASDVRTVLEDPNIPAPLKRFVREASTKADAQMIASLGSATDEELTMIRAGGEAYSAAVKKAANKELRTRTLLRPAPGPPPPPPDRNPAVTSVRQWIEGR